MTDEERADISNGIWLCKPCHKKLDRDWKQFPVETLRDWKKAAEARAESQQDKDVSEDDGAAFHELKALWCHETTNDSTYVRRHTTVRTLDGWFNDRSVRAISVTGIGGAGKTSLVGSWLKHHNSNLFRDIRGVFYWSFYADKDIDRFLVRLMEFLEELAPISINLQRDVPLDAFTKALKDMPAIALVLDGLEVLQHAMSETRSYGAFVDAKLRDFLLLITYAKAPWICVITSRFPITDLKSSQAVKLLSLSGLDLREAEELLYENGVMGTEAQRKAVAAFLEGHPLTLRLFAASLPKERIHAPKQHLMDIFGDSGDYGTFGQKLRRLLIFYSGSLNEPQRSIIHAMSLFRSPVPVSTIVKIGTMLRRREDVTPAQQIQPSDHELHLLHTSGLVLRDHFYGQPVYSCHPVIRDFFRAELFGHDRSTSLEAIDYLTTRPDELGLQGVTSVEPIVLSIESLLELGELSRALELYVTRLQNGKVFLERGLPQEGKRTFDALAAFRDGSPNAVAISERIGRERFPRQDATSFLIGAAEFNIELGEYNDALDVANRALRSTQFGRKTDALRCLSRISFCCGDFHKAAEYAERALKSITTGAPRGTLAYKYALAVFYFVRVLCISGNHQEAAREAKAFIYLREHLDSPDMLVLRPLVELWISICKRGNPGCGKAARDCAKEIAGVSVDHLALAARLTVAHGYILAGRTEKAAPLIDGVYRKAVRHSYPHRLCSAMILREYAAFRGGRPASLDRLSEAADMAAGGAMEALRAEALRCSSLVTNDRERARQWAQEADMIADLTGYAALRWAFPVN